MDRDTRISKRLSYWLRHRPDAGRLTLDAAGWANVDSIMAALNESGLALDRDELNRIVGTNDKRRYEFSADGSRIRARQGHSIPIDAEWRPADPPPRLFHGTIERFLPAIMSEGLKPMKRHHVHLSPDEQTARAVGARRGKPVILAIDAAALAAQGHPFYLTGNGVWLTDCVPPEFITRITA